MRWRWRLRPTAAGVAALAQHFLGLSDLSLVFMLAVVLVAAHTDTGPAMLAALLWFLAYNFFFIEPRYTFYIEANHAVATVLLFLAAAIIAGRLAARLSANWMHCRKPSGTPTRARGLSQRLALAGDEEARAGSGTHRHSSEALDAPGLDPARGADACACVGMQGTAPGTNRAGGSCR